MEDIKENQKKIFRNRNKQIALRFTEKEKNDYIKLCKTLNLSQTDTLIYLINAYNNNKN